MEKIMSPALSIGLAGCATDGPPSETDDLNARWTIESNAERPVIDRGPACIEFTPRGFAGCNAACGRFTGKYLLSGANLALSKSASARKLCPSALMEQETRFLAALGRVAKVQLREGPLFAGCR